ncbi:MAG: response regulator [bacterium]|nr:response regulator [bacterium]
MKKRILWIDDEVDNLKSLMYFLENEGYEVQTASNGLDGVEHLEKEFFDLIFLDQFMPGIDGIETLSRMREISQKTPIIMVTKADDKSIIDTALSLRVDDYLIKPVSPLQVLATIKRIVERKSKIKENLGKSYSQTMRRISDMLSSSEDSFAYAKIHHIMSQWNLSINREIETDIKNMHSMQKSELNSGFSKYVLKNYRNWIKQDKSPVMSHTLLSNHVNPILKDGKRVFFLLIDCMRYDHYLLMETFLSDLFKVSLNSYFSILPTATPYSRNAIFAGMLPSQIAANYPEKWDFADSQSQNQYEEEFLRMQMRQTLSMEDVSYAKVSTNESLKKYIQTFSRFEKNRLNVLIINIMDVFTHFRSESEILKDMLPDENSLLAFISTWFRTSGLLDFFSYLTSKKNSIVITSDHGSIISKDPLLMNTGKDVSINLKYKFGSSIQPQSSGIAHIDSPEDWGLPVPKRSDKWYLATGNGYLVYSTKFNQYKKEYFNTFQHGGISMEEMILPIGIVEAKNA